SNLPLVRPSAYREWLEARAFAKVRRLSFENSTLSPEAARAIIDSPVHETLEHLDFGRLEDVSGISSLVQEKPPPRLHSLSLEYVYGAQVVDAIASLSSRAMPFRELSLTEVGDDIIAALGELPDRFRVERLMLRRCYEDGVGVERIEAS